MNLLKLRFDDRHRLNKLAERVETLTAQSVITRSQQQVTLRLSNQRFGWNQVHQFGKQMVRLLEDPEVRVLRIDLSGLEQIGSEALTQFVAAHCRASQLGKQVILENVGEHIRHVLHVTRIDRLLQIADRSVDRQSAIEGNRIQYLLSQ